MKSNVFLCSVDVEMLTPALKIWRNAVVTSESASQLSMCLLMLFDCVAWEKSIMKVVRMSWCTCVENTSCQRLGAVTTTFICTQVMLVCGRNAGLMVSALNSGSSSLGSYPGKNTPWCSSARHSAILPLHLGL